MDKEVVQLHKWEGLDGADSPVIEKDWSFRKRPARTPVGATSAIDARVFQDEAVTL